jgi:hypothetical protein
MREILHAQDLQATSFYLVECLSFSTTSEYTFLYSSS